MRKLYFHVTKLCLEIGNCPLTRLFAARQYWDFLRENVL
jgi:hypothetical protein